MWREFARCAAATRDGAPPVDAWPETSVLTQEVLCAILDSLRGDCKTVQL